MYKLPFNPSGSWTVYKEFVPMFYQITQKEFVPLEIKRLSYENKNTKTSKPRCSRFNQA